MSKTFNITNICPFDLMRWGRDTTYNKLGEEYNERFGENIEILEAKLNFIENGLSVVILTSREMETDETEYSFMKRDEDALLQLE